MHVKSAKPEHFQETAESAESRGIIFTTMPTKEQFMNKIALPLSCWPSKMPHLISKQIYKLFRQGERKVITTDLHGTCTNSHTGTSASSPMAAGILALVLEVESFINIYLILKNLKIFDIKFLFSRQHFHEALDHRGHLLEVQSLIIIFS